MFWYEELFHILATCKLERKQKIDEAGGGGAREGMLACKPFDFEKRPLVHLLIDNLLQGAKIIFRGTRMALALKHLQVFESKGKKCYLLNN